MGLKPYYETELGKLYHGDCLEILPQLTEKVDLVLTDPPYGVNFKGKNAKSLVNNKKGYDIHIDTPEYIDNICVPIVKLCIEKYRRVIITPGVRNQFKYPQPEDVGCVYYPAGSGIGRWGFVCYQPIFYYGKDPYTENRLGSRPNSFIETETAEPNGHPCPKPIKFWQKLLKRGSVFETETILDPFLGSGTTAVACERLGRRWIGIEISKEYCDIAVKRIEQERAQLNLSL